MKHKQKDGHSKKKSKGNARDQKYSSKSKEYLDGFISRLYMAEKRISELEDISPETSKTEMQGEKQIRTKENSRTAIFQNILT